MSSIEDDFKELITDNKKEESDLNKIVKILLDSRFKRRKTILRNRIIPALTTMDTIAQLYDVEWYLNWIDGYTEYITSVDGQGRKDIVDITKFTIAQKQEREDKIIEMLGRKQ